MGWNRAAIYLTDWAAHMAMRSASHLDTYHREPVGPTVHQEFTQKHAADVWQVEDVAKGRAGEFSAGFLHH